MPSLFLSLNFIRPVFSQFLNHSGIITYSLLLTVSIRLTFENTDTAGAVVYKIVINNNANPTDFLASLTFLTVKNLTITWGKPAVPTMSAMVIQNTSITDFDPLVYSVKPKSFDSISSLSRRYIPEPSLITDPIPSWGIKFPVIWIDIKIAGTIKAKIRTQYCAT